MRPNQDFDASRFEVGIIKGTNPAKLPVDQSSLCAVAFKKVRP
jgi:hypothetical protein